jgi:hypothetical protein
MTKGGASSLEVKKNRVFPGLGSLARVSGRWGFYGLYGDKTAGPAAVDEVHPASNLGIEGVIFAPADVQTGLQPGAALADDDGTTGDYLASEDFHTQSLSIGVAAIFGTA